ncbi:hypothetical protein HYPSUDRAFT_209691 [Hypholoma sublateritium FD-334 SS-4]|uniref:Uncharacterized protein n=1 Tax=Hypholoma sublateritium (strain FD-334 SS-4) TaxID=945553 RepID=A0A0D2LR37_HYPSF|nr:hypothetical protein HYPSUDRAFT_209691 [Hypholoma sublateritium FD-334 SS-4]
MGVIKAKREDECRKQAFGIHADEGQTETMTFGRTDASTITLSPPSPLLLRIDMLASSHEDLVVTPLLDAKVSVAFTFSVHHPAAWRRSVQPHPRKTSTNVSNIHPTDCMLMGRSTPALHYALFPFALGQLLRERAATKPCFALNSGSWSRYSEGGLYTRGRDRWCVGTTAPSGTSNSNNGGGIGSREIRYASPCGGHAISAAYLKTRRRSPSSSATGCSTRLTPFLSPLNRPTRRMDGVAARDGACRRDDAKEEWAFDGAL